MPPKLPMILLVAFLYFVNCASAQSPVQRPTPAIVRDPQAITLLQQALTALGASLGGVPTSITASGTYTKYTGDGSETSYPIRLKTLGNDKFRREVDLSDGTHVAIVHGAVGWAVHPKETDGLSTAQLAGNTFEDLPVFAITQWLNSGSVKLRAMGTETVAGASLIHISVQPTGRAPANDHLEGVYEETSRCEIFLDPQNNLPVRLRYYAHPTDWRRALPVDLEFSDFRSVSGVLFPFTISRYMNGRKLSAIQWQDLRPGSTVSDGDFMVGVTQ